MWLTLIGIVGSIFILVRIAALPAAQVGTAVDVLVLKDLDRLVFVNDSEVRLEECVAIIDGGFLARIGDIAPHARGYALRETFSGGTARDEWYSRVIRGLSLRCRDGADRLLQVNLK